MGLIINHMIGSHNRITIEIIIHGSDYDGVVQMPHVILHVTL